MFLSFCECHSMSSFYDNDNNNNDIIHLYSKKNSVLHQYAEKHSHAWSCNAISTSISISIRQKLINSDLWVLKMFKFISFQCSQCQGTFTQLIKIIDKDNKTVKVMMNIIDDVKNVKKTEKRICFKHQKKLTETAEFQVKLLNSKTLQDWLQTYWIN